MKKIIFIVNLLIILISVELFASSPPADSVASFTEKTTIGATDLMLIQTKISNKYTWRKLTGLSLWNFVDQVIDTNKTSFLATSNTFTGIQTFNGAVFDAGSHGLVLFDGDSVVCTTQMFTHGIQRYSVSSIIGRNTAPFFNVYTKTLTIINSAETDSSVITLDDNGDVSIPNLTVTETINIDSTASLRLIRYAHHDYTIPNSTDTILTILAADRYSLIELDLPGNITNGISRLYVEGATIGTVICFYTEETSFEMLFKNYSGSDDNIYMGSNFTMGKYDMIEFICVVESIIGQTWAQRYRSDN